MGRMRVDYVKRACAVQPGEVPRKHVPVQAEPEGTAEGPSEPDQTVAVLNLSVFPPLPGGKDGDRVAKVVKGAGQIMDHHLHAACQRPEVESHEGDVHPPAPSPSLRASTAHARQSRPAPGITRSSKAATRSRAATIGNTSADITATRRPLPMTYFNGKAAR